MCACGGKCKGKSESGFYEWNGQSFTSKEVFQTQVVRVMDVLVIGPVLIYASTIKSLPMWLRIFLFIVGIATIIYNGNNYIKQVH